MEGLNEEDGPDKEDPAGSSSVIFNQSSAFACTPGAKCTLFKPFPVDNYYNTMACMFPDPANDIDESCVEVDGFARQEDYCSNYSTCSLIHYNVGFPNSFDTYDAGCYARQVTDVTFIPCPLNMGAMCNGSIVNPAWESGGCAPYRTLTCCYCGLREWYDTSKYCSRVIRDFFDCVWDEDCEGNSDGPYCTYDVVTDWGYCHT